MSETNKPRRIKVTDDLGNVAYVHHTAQRGWCCTLSNGMPATMFYAVGRCDEMALTFALEDATTDEQRLRIVQAHAGARRKAELV